MFFLALSFLWLAFFTSAYYIPTTSNGTIPSIQGNGSLTGKYSPAFGPSFQGTENTSAVKVGIIGAGASGLYAAMLLQSFGIPYEILEANDRPGGRIWTHYFDEEKWNASKPGEPDYYDYFDVGAMRIPATEYMDRVIGQANSSLVNYINANVNGTNKLSIIPFIFTNNNTFYRYNDNLQNIKAPISGSPFQVGISSSGGNVPDQFAEKNPITIWENITRPFTNALAANFEQGFKELGRYDSLSVRDYLRQNNFTDQEIDWLETVDDATGHYDMGFPEMALEEWIFGDTPENSWVTVEGGMSRLINGMLMTLNETVRYSQRVEAIAQTPSQYLSVSTNDSTFNYSHVINTVPLGAMQAMDMSTLNLGYAKESAIRMINYDPASKIGIKFKTRWWENFTNPIKGGASYSDLPIRTCVYPSYGVNTTGAAATMIASYTWGQDSSRIGSYLGTPTAEQDLINDTLRDLALLNNVTFEFLKEQYVNSFAWSWYNSEYSVGAFPVFGPGQFVGLVPSLLTPGANGRLHFGGDALSAGHAWIVGALNSAYRCVAEVLATENRLDLLKELQERWGTLREMDITGYNATAETPLTS